MYNKFTKQVRRVPKKHSGLISKMMIILGIFFVVGGILMDRGLFLLACLMVLIYYLHKNSIQREYEYTLENEKLSIDVIKGGRRRRKAHELDLKDLEVVAPNWHSAVAQYRKDGGTVSLPKYDYTSYDDAVPYYTMIITEDEKKIKLLLDLDDEMLQFMKRLFPQKVYLS